MDDLTYALRKLCRRNRDGSHATQGDRLRSLTLIARELREEGFRNMQLTSLKRKHVDALVRRWQAKGLSAGTQKNRLAHLRWWAEKVGKSSAIPARSAELGIPERRFVTNESKARELHMMNITAKSLFPGAEGLGRSIEEIARLSIKFGRPLPPTDASIE